MQLHHEAMMHVSDFILARTRFQPQDLPGLFGGHLRRPRAALLALTASRCFRPFAPGLGIAIPLAGLIGRSSVLAPGAPWAGAVGSGRRVALRGACLAFPRWR